MPASDIIDKDFLIVHQGKIKKLYEEQQINGSIKVLLSKVTKNHLYPQIGGASGSEIATNFLKGLQNNGLGKYVEDLGHKYFEMIDLDNIENIPEETLNLLNDLGINLKQINGI